MNKTFGIGSVLALLLLLQATVSAQITGLAGTLGNDMVKVTNVDAANNSVDVTSSAAFSIGDTVLVMQMKGASIDINNASTFGDINDIANAGGYEFATICDVQGNTITFTNLLLNNYDPDGYVQLIRVPVYQNVVIGGTLTEQAWNVNTGVGGVMVVAARGWLRVNAPVRMNGTGFAGGWDMNGYAPCDCNCGAAPQYQDYYYNSGNCRSAAKGESIADSIPGREFGRGKLAAGGGGGNDHNSGGAGGANYGAGGNGGTTINPSCFFFGGYCRGQFAGVGGVALSSPIASNDRIFLGSGGGSGHDNNTTGTPGASGGGIIILIADSIEGGNRQLEAIGNGQLFNAVGDGSGGGGAGGTIILNTRAYGPGALTLNVAGGKGGDNSWGGSSTNCKGPGGGGGGGAIWSATATIPANYTTLVTGGIAGSNVGATCNGMSLGAGAGGAGAVLNNWVFRTSFNPFSGCVLPVEYAYFNATAEDAQVALDWGTTYESNSAYFDVQRSFNGATFTSIGRVNSAGNSASGETYRFIDDAPVAGELWYRLREVDQNGASLYSEIRSVFFDGIVPELQSVYPNPVSGNDLNIELLMPAAGNIDLELVDIQGRTLLRIQEALSKGSRTLQLPVGSFADGFYLLKVNGARQTVRKVVIRR
ncbi:MAG: T9SS type A sorting domain-containing protein [Bacteroidota bacterium]